MEQACEDNVLSGTNFEHYSLASGDIPRIEIDPREINHDHYRFAYDLVEKVLKIRGELNYNIPHNLPEPSNYLFTKNHETLIERLIEQDNFKKTLFMKIHRICNGVYNSRSYLECRDFFVKDWEDKAFTENSFITACAYIAYVAAIFIQMNYHCGALDDVVVYIARWIGTVYHSLW